MNVTPDSDAPIMPYATSGHGIFLSPTKNVSVLAFLDVKYETTNNAIVNDKKAISINQVGIVSNC